MKKYKHYIIGAVVLLIGFCAGWIFKPSPSPQETTDHSKHSIDMSSSKESGVEDIWTCSMHPQIRQNEPGLCPICEMDLILLDNSFSNDDPTVLQMSLEATKLAQIETTIVGGARNHSRNEPSMILVDGSIEMDERSINSQTAHIAGRLESMLINFEGEYVRSGQKIASIYSTDLLAASQELITAARYNDRVVGLKDASIQKLKNWKISDSQINQILQSGNSIETIDIFADHSGYVLSKKVSQGDYVRTGQSLYTLGSTARLWLIFNVYESDLAGVRKGQQINFTTPALGAEELSAKVTYIDPLLNADTRTASVRAEIANTGNRLKPGMLIKGKINVKPLTKASSAVSIPKSAVLWTGDKSVVYVKLKDSEVPSFQFREVTIGDQSGNQISVVNGLENGEEIVTSGAFAIDAAAQLNNNMSMMNRNVEIKSTATSNILPDFVDMTPSIFKEQLTELAKSYLLLKEAFVDTDATTAKSAANNVFAAAENIDMSILQEEPHLYWMDLYTAIKSHSSRIVELDDVEDQRNQFQFLSEALINSVKVFGILENTLYVQYCPMAFDNQGAEWLSSESIIANPYFGDKMHKCGSVKDSIIFNYKINQ